MPRPRGSGTSTICFRVLNDTRDILLAAAYDYERERADATGRFVDPDDVNVSDLIRTVLDDWLTDYARARGGPNALIRSLLEARAEQSATRHTEALARLEEVDAVAATVAPANSAATRQGRRSAKLAQTQGPAKAGMRAAASAPAKPAKQRKPVATPPVAEAKARPVRKRASRMSG